MMNVETHDRSQADIAREKAEQKLWNHVFEESGYIRRVFPEVHEASNSVYRAFRTDRKTHATITAITGTTAYTASHFVEGKTTRPPITIQNSDYTGWASDILIPGNQEKPMTDCALISFASRQRLRPIAKLADSFDPDDPAFMIGYPQILPFNPDPHQLILFARLSGSVDYKSLLTFGITDPQANLVWGGLSGGALCNHHGELLGILAWILPERNFLTWGQKKVGTPSYLGDTRNVLQFVSLLPGSPFRVNL